MSYLTFILLFLRRLDEPRGENGNELWDFFHLQENSYTFMFIKHFARE